MTTTTGLGELIAQVQAAKPGDSLDQVEEAVAVAARMNEVGDHLIGHFIDVARGEGLSWTQIGTRLGVSKQAARKRFEPGEVSAESSALKEKAFGRYSAVARHAIVLASAAARQHHHGYIGTEHLLLGVLREPEGLGVRVVAATGPAPDVVERVVVARLGEPSEEVPEMIPFTGKAKKALELTLRAALRLGHERVGTEHLLLGLVEERAGLAATVLAGLGFEPPAMEAEVVRLAGG